MGRVAFSKELRAGQNAEEIKSFSVCSSLEVPMLLIALALAAEPSTYLTALANPSGWTEVGRKTIDGVGEVVTKHKQISGVDCLEGATVVDVGADVLLSKAVDIDHQGTWSSWKVPYSKKLSQGGNTFDYVQVLDNPSPVADRYWFARGTVVTEGSTKKFQWQAIDPATYSAAFTEVTTRYPGAVVPSINVGEWSFTPVTGGTDVRYRICTDSGGSIPTWVGEFAARTTLPTNVADLVKAAKGG